MQFVTGGAFNGKSKWVKAYNGINGENCHWFSAYRHQEIPSLEPLSRNMVVIEGVEQWIKDSLTKYDPDMVRQQWQELLDEWQQWEKKRFNRKVIIIGSDITKGIVPIREEDRIWRDVTGRALQDTAEISESVHLVWYGIGQKLK